ncbi:hypothetical protein JEQ21_07820 [Streptococcus sp. 121]|uniref:hypothetical protein n=1 Tax=Streptococcus sp. 121 TaxID=2797637 RepID=UPI0018F0B835|nr:hypothetical protein [Streptococcus sp. 121]MBJ6746360.1 hypothetical protein [Streptococcus sp. 121]
MTLEVFRSVRLEGQLKVGETVVKTMTAEFDDKGTARRSEWINDEELYTKNRKQMRKHEKEFQAKVFEVEDEILADLEDTETAETEVEE